MLSEVSFVGKRALPFEPAEPNEPEIELRSAFKPVKKRAGKAVPPPPEKPPDEPPTRTKKRKPLAKVTVEAAPWQAWIDPAALLWLPLPIVLAVFVGSALFSLILPPVGNEDGVMNINIVFLTFSAVLAFLPLAYLLSHWMQIAGAWSIGDRADPPFPDFDVSAILVDFLRLIPAAGFALLVSGWILLLDIHPAWIKSAAASLLFVLYFSVAMLAVSLQSHWAASNPVSILMAFLRMSRGRIAFLVEASLHLIGGFLIWRAIFALWEKNWDVGMLVWGALWVYVFFAGARLMRAAGMYYRVNANRVGWFT
jgi:hypothetical protein